MVDSGITAKKHLTLGQFIRARRLTLGMTQEQLAERAAPNVRQSD
jgi:predicted transcriptional regulator